MPLPAAVPCLIEHMPTSASAPSPWITFVVVNTIMSVVAISCLGLTKICNGRYLGFFAVVLLRYTGVVVHHTLGERNGSKIRLHKDPPQLNIILFFLRL
jgi:hypothetical protein